MRSGAVYVVRCAIKTPAHGWGHPLLIDNAIKDRGPSRFRYLFTQYQQLPSTSRVNYFSFQGKENFKMYNYVTKLMLVVFVMVGGSVTAVTTFAKSAQDITLYSDYIE
mgnify:CR=1 FL=1